MFTFGAPVLSEQEEHSPQAYANLTFVNIEAQREQNPVSNGTLP